MSTPLTFEKWSKFENLGKFEPTVLLCMYRRIFSRKSEPWVCCVALPCLFVCLCLLLSFFLLSSLIKTCTCMCTCIFGFGESFHGKYKEEWIMTYNNIFLCVCVCVSSWLWRASVCLWFSHSTWWVPSWARTSQASLTIHAGSILSPDPYRRRNGEFCTVTVL